MTDSASFFRALALHLRPHRRFDAAVGSDADAVRFFVDAVHDGACPGCGGGSFVAAGRHHLDCDRCGRVSVYRGTPLHHRRLRLTPLLAALHAIHVDTTTPSARGFARAWTQRLDTTWNLLHEIRDALPVTPLPEVVRAFPLLGNDSGDNVAGVALGVDAGVLGAAVVVIDEGVADGVVGDGAVEAVDDAADDGAGAVLSVFWGQLRAWVTAVFRCVSRGHLDRYLREWCDRHGRVRALAEAR